MSKTVDQRVVEMQFDNRHFERNVSTTMSTLEKLKKSLKIPDSSKSLENIGHAAKNVNLSGLTSAVDTVHAKFSALQVIGVTALANITNSAINTGKQIVKAFTIDPVKTGFQEYELKMGSIQTIMAGTGESLERVNQKLNELNEYSDQTIYSFQDMTSNIGKFTNAGVGLDDAVAAIKGISNAAALSGANTNEASRAMYNFSQALSAGYVQLIDWKSIELANMGTAEFRKQLIEAAVAVGTLTKSSDGFYKTIDGNTVTVENFRNTLQDRWLTSDALITALKNYADGTTDIGQRATAAATEVKTFTMMMDTLKESVQSGWARTWEILVGDFEEAKSVFTTMSKYFGKIIETVSDARNNLLENALSSPWEKLIAKVNEAGIETDDFVNKLRKNARKHNKALDSMSDEQLTLNKMLEDGIITKGLFIETLSEYADNATKVSGTTEDLTAKLAYFQDVVDRVWRGEFKNAPERYQLLADAGYDYAKVQELVNKTVDGHRLTLEDLSDEQLKSIGYTDEQIATIKELASEAKKAGTPLNELIDKIAQPSGRELLLESFKNILEAITKPLNAIKEAWDETFDTNDDTRLYTIIEKFNELTESLIISDEAAENLKKVFEGLFAGFQVGNLLISKTFSSALKIFDSILQLFGTDLGKVGGIIADYILQLRDWIKEHTIFIDTYNKIAKVIVTFIEGIHSCIQAFWNLDAVQKIIGDFSAKVGSFFGDMNKGFDVLKIDEFCAKIASAFEDAKKWIESLNDSENLGQDLINGLVNGLREGVKKVVSTVVELATSIIETFCSITKIASPSKVFFALGGFLIAGLIAGLQNGFPTVWEAIKSFGSKCIEIIKNIDLGVVIAAGLGAGILFTIKKMLDLVKMFARPAEGLGNMLDGLGSMFKSFGKRFEPKQASKWTTISKAILSVAAAIAILAGAAYILGNMETGELIQAGVAITVLMALMAGLLAVTKKIDPSEFTTSFVSIVAVAGAILIMAIAMKKVAAIQVDDWKTTLGVMASMIIGLGVIIASLGLFVKGKTAMNMAKAGGTIMGIAAAFLIMAYVFKIVGGMRGTDLGKGLLMITALEILFLAMVAASHLAGKHATKAGKMLLLMSGAFLIMIGVIKLASMLRPEDIVVGLSVITLIGGLFTAFITVSYLAGENADRAGKMLLSMSIALGIAVYVIKKASELKGDEVLKGIAVIAALEILFTGIIAVSKLAGENAAKAGILLLEMSAAMLIMVAAIHLLGKLPENELKQGLGAVAVISALFMGLIAVTSLAKDCKATLIAITVAIGVLAVALIALAFIPAEKLEPATEALVRLMTTFGFMIAAMKLSKEINIKTLLSMVTMVAVLGGIVMGLSLITNPDAAVKVATALGILLIAFGSTMAILSITGDKAVPGFKALATLTLVVAALGGILLGMSKLETVNAIENATALSILLNAMAAAMLILSYTTPIASTATKSLLLMGVVVAEIAVILGVMSALNVEASISTAIALSILLNAMAAAMLILSYTTPITSVAITSLMLMGVVVAEIAIVLGVMDALDVNASIPTAIAISTLLLAMSAAMAILSAIPVVNGVNTALQLVGFVGIIGLFIAALAALSKIPGFKEFMQSGGEILTDLGLMIGNFVGSIFSGFGAGLLSGLPLIGTYLSEFMENVQPFIEGAKSFNKTILDNVATLAKVILMLTAAEILDGIAYLLRGKSSLASFGEQLPILGEAFTAFTNSIGTFTEDQIASVSNACDCIKLLAEASQEIPNNGGILGAIVGNNDIGTFGTMLSSVGSGLRDFIDELGTFTKTEVDTVNYAGQAIGALAKVANEIPNAGGWLGAIIGENNIDDFGDRLPAMATGLRSFITNIGAITDDEVENVKRAANAIVKLANAADSIPGSGGWIDTIVGSNDIDTFGEKLPTLGTNIKDFANNLDGFSKDDLESVQNASSGIVSLANAAERIPNDGGWLGNIVGNNDIGSFGSKLADLGSHLSEFANNVAGISDQKMYIVGRIVDAVVNLTNLDLDAASVFCESMRTLALDAVDSFVEGLTCENTTVNARSAITTFIKNVSESASNYRSITAFKNAAYDLVKGFAEGIDLYTYVAENAATRMTNAAIEAAKEALDSHSPSRVFYDIGGFAGLGFVNGLDAYNDIVFRAGGTMADSARRGLSDAIRGISSVIDNNIDAQPTIRPVLDLSDIQSGTTALGSMLDMGAHVGVTSNLGAISSMMALRGQNGTNADVVSAIDKLRHDLGNVGNTTYQVNGVTYDDGSNISEAVRTLVRAAKIERRV